MSDFDYKYLEKFLRYKLHHYRDDLEFDDAIQEGLIRAWKDNEKGTFDPKHLRNRAWSWGHNFLYCDHHYATGDLGRSREGITKKNGDLIREKVSLFQDEYISLHGKKPTQQVVADGIGVPKTRVREALRTLKATSYVKPIYYTDSQGKTRLDKKAYVKSPLYRINDSGDEIIDPRAENIQAQNWEEEFSSNEAFYSMIEPLNREQKAVLVLVFVYGMSQREIVDYLNIPGKTLKAAQNKVSRMYREALAEIKTHLGVEVPDTGTNFEEEEVKTCSKGHLRTASNTRWSENRTRRYCIPCEKAYREENAERNAAKCKAYREAQRNAGS